MRNDKPTHARKNCRKNHMKDIFMYKRSLVAKLALAFILVAVPPMLVASNAATRLVSGLANMNVEHWLREAANYIFYEIDECMDELSAVHLLLRERFAQDEITFTADELKAFSSLDAEYLLLKDPDGNVLYANAPLQSMDEEALFPGSSLKWASMTDRQRELVVTVKEYLTARNGSRRSLELASGFSIQLSEGGGNEPVELRIFLPDGDGFRMAYSSSASAGQHTIPPEAASALRGGATEYFIPDADWTDNTPNAHFLLRPFRNAEGEILAVFMLSALMLPLDGNLPSYATLFCSFFIFGTALSGGAGYFLARRMVQPIKQLNEGVRSIATGNLGQRVTVHGDDEVAELSTGFNLMAAQLEIMRHDGVQSARRERSRMLGEIALGFAHEIRNPLVVIKTSAEVVHAALLDKPKETRLLGFVVEEVGRIDSLVSEFLAFAKPAPPVFEYFHLHALAKEILELSAAECARRGINWTLVDETGVQPGQADPAGDNVLGERNQIRQVVLNLVINSMDAMPEGGDLAVRLYKPDSSARVCLEVSDTGVGIAPDILPSIHMPFISTKKNGLGLGLAKAYAIIDEHGGSIVCSSEPGKKTIFTMCLNG